MEVDSSRNSSIRINQKLISQANKLEINVAISKIRDIHEKYRISKYWTIKPLLYGTISKKCPKKRSSFVLWQTRYFYLFDDALAWTKTKGKEESIGILPLFCIIKIENLKNMLKIQISKERSLELKFKTIGMKNMWHKNLQELHNRIEDKNGNKINGVYFHNKYWKINNI